MKDKKLGVYLGRFNPIHNGHVAVIDEMVAKYGDNSLIIIGSANAPQSLRHFFSYGERREFIKLIYKWIRVVALPDQESNDEWFISLCDIISLLGHTIDDVEFFTGCAEDVVILSQYTKNFVFVNRFDGTTPKISATEVRDALMQERPLDDLVHTNVKHTLLVKFAKKWIDFRKK